MARLKLTLAYTGARLHGWQIQEHKTGRQPRTVQGCLEQAFAKILGAPIRVQGASRTDAGVHALCQVAHVDVPDEKAGIQWQRALNHNLPRDVEVIDVTPVPETFHARYDAQSKIYTYSVWLNRQYVLPQRRVFVWETGPLDLEAMDRAAAHFVGEHDFASFQNIGSIVQSTVRTLLSINRTGPAPEESGPGWPEVVWRFHGQGFLKQMVRNLMGCLVYVGRGKLDADVVPQLLALRDRNAAPPTAPAQGLTLERMFY